MLLPPFLNYFSLFRRFRRLVLTPVFFLRRLIAALQTAQAFTSGLRAPFSSGTYFFPPVVKIPQKKNPRNRTFALVRGLVFQ